MVQKLEMRFFTKLLGLFSGSYSKHNISARLTMASTE